MQFDTICLIGNGILSKECCRFLTEKHNDIRFFDANEKPSWYLQRQCDRYENVKYYCLEKKELFDEIEKIPGAVIVISAVNPYIIPRKIVDCERFFAVNLHHSLLPLHPGRNAEAWTIYEEDKYAGITWHCISNEVDGGDVIANSKIELTDDITSWKLLKIQNDLAFAEFEKFADDMLNGNLSYSEQDRNNITGSCKLHYSYEVPNDGIFDMRWPQNKMSAFLRAMDYGPARVLGVPKVERKGSLYEIKKYSIKTITYDSDDVTESDTMLQIRRDGKEINLYY